MKNTTETTAVAFSCAKRTAEPSNETAACRTWCGDCENCYCVGCETCMPSVESPVSPVGGGADLSAEQSEAMVPWKNDLRGERYFDRYEFAKIVWHAALAAVRPAPTDIAAMIHYPACWDTAAYPTVEDALREVAAFKCSECVRPAQADQEPSNG